MPGIVAGTSVETNEPCAYGCGAVARFRTKAGAIMCSAFSSQCVAVRGKQGSALSKAYAEGRKTVHENFLNAASATRPGLWNRARERARDRLLVLPFEKLSGDLKRLRIMDEQEGKCAMCRMLPVWNGRPLVLQLDHIAGKQEGEGRSNLRLICPNCHSQTETWCSKNSASARSKINRIRPTGAMADAHGSNP